MAIYEEVLPWADRLPPWRQDALRRLCVQGGWTEADLDEILDLAKQHHGISSEIEPTPQPIRFTADHFPAEANQDRTVALTSLHTLLNVGKIPSDQILEFQPHGLTIVYGGNGTGKSGYARVLKQACRARSPGTVYANAYDPDFQKLTPSATIDFEVDDTSEQEFWSGQRSHVPRTELRAISVFDGDCARHYLQAREAASFQPVALTYLKQLANGINQALRPRLEAEIAGLAVDVTPFNIIPADTEAGQAIHPISSTMNLEQARALGTLTQEEQAELTCLPKEINEADPTVKATLLDNAATNVENLANNITAAANTVSNDSIDAARTAHQRLLEAETAESAASAFLQAEDAAPLLPGTGQGAWALLFNAAREYSTSIAYPGQAFPVTDNGAVCLLCQQELTPEAKDRLHRFDRYVRDTAAEAAQAARNAWQQIVRDVGQATVTFTVSQVMSDSLGGRIATLPDDIRTFREDLVSRLQWLRTAIETGEWQNRPAYRSANPTASIQQIANILRAEAAALRANLNAEALTAKRLRLKELEARRLLSEHIESIAQVVDNLAHKAKLQSCLADIGNSRPISLFAGQLAKKYVSEALASRMNEELRKLDLYHIRAGISSTGDAGSVRLGILLHASQLDPHLVLSEAEQRICSLAYFFAELHQSGSSSGIVLDDPVSSLDHNHRTAVARRIIEEAANRQVIVFTHDAVFFGELITLGTDAQLTPNVKSISYRAEGPGYIDAGLPYDMRKHRDRITQHRADHQRIAENFINPPGDEERLAIRNAYDDLRVTIEVGIEDTVLNETVVRFRDGISVGRLNGVMIVQEAEYREVQRLHDRCCRNVRAHSHAAGQQRAVTQPDELLQDIEAVNTLFQTIRRRRG
ncbi:AAA family ATPase [Halomonas sp. MCCC 1A11036]|uniref:AAA family ATPase n=1 Tax=Billgrantia zhangzhouensis TaxID=2733481 RepID=A0ABS9AJX6_9GAMM|nr:AAA family ATPase [Halomonas zhangzhouensis]MCE8022021.1 AAA family ATPase [Halomonas zhangzhouensis]